MAGFALMRYNEKTGHMPFLKAKAQYPPSSPVVSHDDSSRFSGEDKDTKDGGITTHKELEA